MGHQERQKRAGQSLIHRLKPSGKQIPNDRKLGGNRAKKIYKFGEHSSDDRPPKTRKGEEETFERRQKDVKKKKGKGSEEEEKKKYKKCGGPKEKPTVS